MLYQKKLYSNIFTFAHLCNLQSACAMFYLVLVMLNTDKYKGIWDNITLFSAFWEHYIFWRWWLLHFKSLDSYFPHLINVFFNVKFHDLTWAKSFLILTKNYNPGKKLLNECRPKQEKKNFWNRTLHSARRGVKM